MRFQTPVVGIVLAASLLAGCSRQSTQQPAPAKTVDLGTVELSAGQPSRHEVGDGLVCVLTAQPLGADSIELVVVLEKSGRKVASTRRAPAAADRPLDVSFPGVHVGLTPHLK